MAAVPTSAQNTSGANPRVFKSENSSPRREEDRASPPPNCAICLGACKNKSFTDSCLHQFCFKCLLTWSKVKAECPLCKQTFKSIIHNVRSNHQYEEYLVEQRQTEEVIDGVDMSSMVTNTRRFRYRTTLTLPRRETIAIQQLLLRYPIMADVLPSAQRRRSPISFRRTVYRYNLWARPLPDFTGRFRDCTPEFYRYNDSQMHRLVPWLNRELHYLLNENLGHISYVITRILDLLPQYHINSSEFRNNMQRFFGERTAHFIHELYCFASTPYDMTGYDRHVQYTTDSRGSTMVNELSSTESEASVDSDIVMISTSEPADESAGPSRVPPANPPVPQRQASNPDPRNVIPIETISQSDSDDDSSEVMVVGYIKPPQDRTPEVVDLLGSDSDVIVQDTVDAPSTSVSTSAAGTSSAPDASLVRLTLRRHDSRAPDSDSDSAYTPSPPDASEPAPAPRRSAPVPRTSAPRPVVRRKRRGSTGSDSTDTNSDDQCTTPSPIFTDRTSSGDYSSSNTETSDSDAPARKRRRVLTYAERCRAARKRSCRVPKWFHRRRKYSRERNQKSISGPGSEPTEQLAGPSSAGPSNKESSNAGLRNRRPSNEEPSHVAPSKARQRKRKTSYEESSSAAPSNRGLSNAASSSTRPRNRKPSNEETNNVEPRNRGLSIAGPSNKRSRHEEQNNAGPNNAKHSNKSPSNTGSKNRGLSNTGQRNRRTSNEGPNKATTSNKGPSTAEPNNAGPSNEELRNRTPSNAVPSNEGPSIAGPSNERPSIVRPSSSGKAREAEGARRTKKLRSVVTVINGQNSPNNVSGAKGTGSAPGAKGADGESVAKGAEGPSGAKRRGGASGANGTRGGWGTKSTGGASGPKGARARAVSNDDSDSDSEDNLPLNLTISNSSSL